MLLSSKVSATLKLLGLAALVSGCGDDDASPVVAEEAASTVHVSALRSSNGAEWVRASPEDLTPAELELPCDGRLVASLVFTNFTARAPGACGSTQQCGHVKVTLISDADATQSAETEGVLGPLLIHLPGPEHFVGNATLSARLLLDNGADYLRADGTSVSSDLPAVFRLAAACAE